MFFLVQLPSGRQLSSCNNWKETSRVIFRPSVTEGLVLLQSWDRSYVHYLVSDTMDLLPQPASERPAVLYIRQLDEGRFWIVFIYIF